MGIELSGCTGPLLEPYRFNIAVAAMAKHCELLWPMPEAMVRERKAKPHLLLAHGTHWCRNCEGAQKTRTAFENAFAAWKNNWFSGGLAINSDPHSRASEGNSTR